MMQFDQVMGRIGELTMIWGLKVVIAGVILVVGRFAAVGARNLIKRLMLRGKVDPTITSFTANLSYVTLLAFIVLAALNHLGIQTTSFIAILGAAGLAIGLALQGSLANFAAGFLMILFRPFGVGDYIEGAGVAGTVEEIQIFTTTLRTPDNKTVIVPNAKLTGDNIINWTIQGTRRVDMLFSISYGDDIDKAKQIIAQSLEKDSRILPVPPPQIAVSALADSSVDIIARPWVRSEDYWGVYFDALENVKKAFDAHGVSIPFPQRDIHVYQHAAISGEKNADAAAEIKVA